MIMRQFTSTGSPDPDLHYYTPRTNLIDLALTHLQGVEPLKGGHYITVWAPRQGGKTWLMQQVLRKLQVEPYLDMYDVVKINLQHLASVSNEHRVAQILAADLARHLSLDLPSVTQLDQFERLFTKDVLPKPLILILDEFDALNQAAIRGLTQILRNIYLNRQDQWRASATEKTYRLHGLALVGVRAVLGVETVSGSPFNVQRSLHVPNLTQAEVHRMFEWYETESGRAVERAVVQRLYDETCGQPGLVGWLGELLTQPKDDQTEESAQAITMTTFRQVYSAAINTLPNSNIINIISKANHEAHKPFILDLFQTQDKIDFRIDDPQINFLYLNGVIDQEIENSQTVEANLEPYVKFSSPFVQKRLFNYFAYELFQQGGRLYDPFDDLNDTITDEVLYLRALLRRYEAYLQVNKTWIFKDTPRRKTDDRIYEAVYHFNLYRYLARFLQSFQGQVWPEFPTGNGKIDLIIRYRGQTYGLEVKSYLNQQAYQSALSQAAQYGKQLGLREIWLAFFVEAIDDARRQTLEVDYVDVKTKVRVRPVFLVVGV